MVLFNSSPSQGNIDFDGHESSNAAENKAGKTPFVAEWESQPSQVTN
jgi:hypothetical protein